MQTQRYILASILIFLVILLQPIYLKWLGIESPQKNVAITEAESDMNINIDIDPVFDVQQYNKTPNIASEREIVLNIVSPLYSASITNFGGGSFKNYIINDINPDSKKYLGGFSDDGIYDSNLPVSLIMPESIICMPCLTIYNQELDEYEHINQAFSLQTNYFNGDTVFLSADDSLILQYSLFDDFNNNIIQKNVHLYGNKYISSHVFHISESSSFFDMPVELTWAGGLRPTEALTSEDIQYSSAIIGQANEIDELTIKANNKSSVLRRYDGQTDWVGLRTKYFISSIIAESPSFYGVLGGENVLFTGSDKTPLYSASLGYPINTQSIYANLYLGPLDIDYIQASNTSLEKSMNLGFVLIRPISLGILKFLKFMHNGLGLNYGLVLILFALIIRIITGPLTKKSFESSQKMQKIQPELKKIQDKFKKDPQRLNKEMMSLYKTHSVNPAGGCLPILIQMPLLWALFVVFRSTIEFRGAPFIFWISDLSKPDYVFSLPFSLPIYGGQVAILPLIMGATLLLTMKMSTATMDKSQKPVMYIMNAFFVLLFNTFPAGLNLYYTVYNFLSFLQQRSIRKNSK